MNSRERRKERRRLAMEKQRLEMEKKSRKFQVVLESDRGMEAWDVMSPVLQEFAKMLQVDIFVSNPHKYDVRSITEEGKLFIRFFAAPQQTHTTEIRRMFGIELNSDQSQIIVPTGTGVQIKDPETGTVVAEIHGGTLYILFDLPHDKGNSENTQLLMKSIMAYYVGLTAPSSEYGEAMKEIQKRLEERKARIEEQKKVFCVKDFEPRCGHWKQFSERLIESFAENGLVIHPTDLYIENASDYNVFDEQRLSVVIRSNRISSRTEGEVIETQGNQAVVYIPKGMYVEVWKIPDCPESSVLWNTIELLKKAIPQAFEPDAVKRTQFAEARKKAAFEELKKKWIEKLGFRLQKQKEETEEAARNHDEKVRECQQEMVKHIREADECRTRARLLETEIQQGDLSARHEREFTQMFKIPHVKDVRIVDNAINVFTDHLYIDEEGKRYDIGEFRIVIHTDGRNGCVRFYNLTRRVDGHWEGSHHPHVSGNGEACLGTIKEAIPELIAKYEYSIVITVCLQFLQSVSTSDTAGRHIVKWPSVNIPQEEGGAA